MKLLLQSDKFVPTDSEDLAFLKSIGATYTAFGRNGTQIFAQKFTLDEPHMARLIHILTEYDNYPNIGLCNDGDRFVLTLD